MTVDEFQSTSIALLRSAVGWQSAIARRLGVERRAVVRWLKEGEIPDWAADRLAAMIGATDIAPWPRDEWMIGDARGGDGRYREYIAHLQAPRFVARIVATDEDGAPMPDERPADLLAGVVYTSGDLALCEIEWIDDVAPGEVVKWLEAAADEIDRRSDEE